MRPTVILALVLLIATVTSARTWIVEKDDSGNYSVIQDAVDAAADWDTIRIGPGRFDDHRIVTYTPGIERDTYVRIADKALTVIGSGQDVTYIGLEDGVYSCIYQEPWGIVVNSVSKSVVISDITVERMGQGVQWQEHDVHVERVTFRDCCIGMMVWARQGGWIRDCQFYGGSYEGIRVMTCDTQLDIYRNRHVGYGYGQAVSVNWSRNVSIDDCHSTNQRVGIKYSDGSSGVVTNCTIESLWFGLLLSESTVSVDNCRISGGQYMTVDVAASSLTMTNSIVQAGSGNALWSRFNSSVHCTGSHLLRGGGYVVKVLSYVDPPDVELNMGGNYWGTASADSLDAWIWDGRDDASIHATVNYEPLSVVPTDSGRRSLGYVKSLFR